MAEDIERVELPKINPDRIHTGDEIRVHTEFRGIKGEQFSLRIKGIVEEAGDRFISVEDIRNRPYHIPVQALVEGKLNVLIFDEVLSSRKK